ncbi:hypothetical protein SCUP515_08826 [Seiridium cupressi]
MAEHVEVPMTDWCHLSVRAYTQMVLCFGFDDHAGCHDEVNTAVAQHLQASLIRLSQQRAYLTDLFRTVTDPETGRKRTERIRRPGVDTPIPYEVGSLRNSYPYSFKQLKKQGFPSVAFLDKRLVVDESPDGVDPAVIVKVFFIEGGFFLGIYLSHQVADGDGCRMFLDMFSAQTCGAMVEHPRELNLDIPRELLLPSATLDELLAQCPEYKRRGEPFRITASVSSISKEIRPKITGRLFSFPMEKLRELQTLLITDQSSPLPSLFAALGALAWAHITKARVSTLDESYQPSEMGALRTIFNWKPRAFSTYSQQHFGNTVHSTDVNVSINTLLQACDDLDVLGSRVVAAISTSISAVDESFMTPRLAVAQRRLLDSVDAKSKLVNIFPTQPKGNLVLNSWRFFGADTKWEIPGVHKYSKPAAIRRPAAGWWSPYGLCIQPAAKDATALELLVQLEAEEMDRLCDDVEWMRWVG